MNTVEYGQKILDELKQSLARVNAADCEALVSRIAKARRVFVAGSGRSLLMLKPFAMRLMHMGLQAYVVGETVTPAIGKGDLLLFGSGSGETGSLASMAKKAKSLDVEMALITIFPQSTIAGLADTVVQISAPTSKAESGYVSIQPGGSCFEQSMLMLLDAMVIRLAEEMEIDANAGIGRRHANLE